MVEPMPKYKRYPPSRAGDGFPLDWSEIKNKYNCVLISKRGRTYAFRSREQMLFRGIRWTHKIGRVNKEHAGLWYRPVDREVLALTSGIEWTFANISEESVGAIAEATFYPIGDLYPGSCGKVRLRLPYSTSMSVRDFMLTIIVAMRRRESISPERLSVILRPLIEKSGQKIETIDDAMAVFDNFGPYALRATVALVHDDWYETVNDTTELHVRRIASCPSNVQNTMRVVINDVVFALIMRGRIKLAPMPKHDELLEALYAAAQQEAAAYQNDDVLPWAIG